MEAEIKSLDEKIQELALLCQKLRKDNLNLRQQLVSAKDENLRLNEKIGAAADQLESLLEKIPEEAK